MLHHAQYDICRDCYRWQSDLRCTEQKLNAGLRDRSLEEFSGSSGDEGEDSSVEEEDSFEG